MSDKDIEEIVNTFKAFTYALLGIIAGVGSLFLFFYLFYQLIWW